MRVRSDSEVLDELRHVDACIADLRDRSAPDWSDDVMLSGYLRRRRELEQELTLSGFGGLQVVLDGRGVDEHRITVSRFIEFIEPLQMSIRSVGAQMVRRDGEAFGTEQRALVEPRLERMFDGSVGLVIGGPEAPPSGEQLDLLRPTLFERAVDRVLSVVAAAHALDVEQAVLDEAAGLDRASISHLGRLASSMSRADAPTRFAWRGLLQPREVLLTLLPGQALTLRAVLEHTTPHVDERVVTGMLASVDNHDGSFHLVGDEGEEFRGSVAKDLLHEAMGNVYREHLRVRLLVHTAVGRLDQTSRPKYELTAILP